MDLGMDGEGRHIEQPGALDDLSPRVHPDEVRNADTVETHPERIDPERVGELGVPRRDVAGDALGESERGEDPQSAGESYLAAAALLRKARRLRRQKAREDRRVGILLAAVVRGSSGGNRNFELHRLPPHRLRLPGGA